MLRQKALVNNSAFKITFLKSR